MLKTVQRSVVLLSLLTALAAIAIAAGAAASASAAARADFNDDGFADLAVGVPGESGNAVQSGGVNVIYGSSSGLSATATPDQYFDQDSADVDGVAEASDYFGLALATGDFNGDGFSDLLAAVPFEDEGGATDAGAIQVIYGSASGLSATGTPDQYLHSNSPDVEGVAETGDQFGLSVASGDFNDDGIADAAIGVPGEDTGPTDDGGMNVIYGSTSGLSATTTPDQYLGQDSPSVDGIAESGDQFGTSVATGDFNEDQIRDVVVGVPFEDEGGTTDGGAINVIYGSATGLSATANSDQYLHPDSPDIEGVAETGDQFGLSLATGDFNGDGIFDAAIGVPREDTGPTDDGGVNVVYGSTSGLSATATPDQYLGQDSSSVDGTAETGDQFGTSVAVGDFDDDGIGDLAIGVPREDEAGSTDTGAINVIFGSATGLSATATADQYLHSDSPDVEGVAEGGDQFGASLATGDFNNDGMLDAAIGVPFEDAAVVASDGGVNVIYGSSSGLSATTILDQYLGQNSPSIEGIAQLLDVFGYAVAA